MGTQSEFPHLVPTGWVFQHSSRSLCPFCFAACRGFWEVSGFVLHFNGFNHGIWKERKLEQDRWWNKDSLPFYARDAPPNCQRTLSSPEGAIHQPVGEESTKQALWLTGKQPRKCSFLVSPTPSAGLLDVVSHCLPLSENPAAFVASTPQLTIILPSDTRGPFQIQNRVSLMPSGKGVVRPSQLPFLYGAKWA